MVTVFLLGFALGFTIGTFLDEIIAWAKNMMARISVWIKRAQVWIQRIPGAIKQFLYYMENGDYMVKETVRRATDEEIRKLRDKMSDKEWIDFTGEGTHMANVERDA